MSKTITICIMLLLLGVLGYARAEPDPAQETTSAAVAQTESSKEDNRLAIYKEGWQIFLAPYVWVPGSNLNVTKQGSHTGTAKLDIPWYDLVPKLFSNVYGAMGRVEVWKGQWGVFVENIFMYVGDSASGAGHKQIRLNQVPVPLNLDLSGRAKVIIRQGGLDVGGRYLVATIPLNSEKQTPVVSFELLGGLRYVWHNQFTGLGFNAALSDPAGRVLLSGGGIVGQPFQAVGGGPFSGYPYRLLAHREV